MLIQANAVLAVDVAPRINDREIIESLAELKAGQREINQRFDAIDQRFDAIDQRFVAIDQRFEAIDQRFEGIDQRFHELRTDMNQRFASLENTMLALFGSIIVLITGIFAYIAWDRRTMLKPVVDRLDKLERDLGRDLDLQHEDGSRLTRLVKVLREMARKDKRLAEVLRSFSLL